MPSFYSLKTLSICDMRSRSYALAIIICTFFSPFWAYAQVKTINTIAGNHTVGYAGDGGPATAAEFSTMTGVAADAFGNVYIADETNYAIRKINNAGIITTALVAYPYSGGLGNVYGIAVDASGNVYSSYGYYNSVLKMSPTGIVTTVIGGAGGGYAGDGGPASAAKLHFPEGLAIDNAGNLYIVDMENSVIRKVDAATGKISTVAGTGTAGFYVGEGNPATAEPLYWPYSVAVNLSGDIYISDGLNGRVMRVDAASGKMYTAAGNGTWSFSGDGGPASTAALRNPQGIATDGTGNLYIADGGNNRVRRVDPAGIITTIAGDSVAGFSGEGGRPDTAELFSPMAIGMDANGNPYILDDGNYIVRKISPPNGVFFTNGPMQMLTACENAPISINTLLAVTDTTAGETNTWNIAAPPVHGTVAASYTAISAGGVMTPAGLEYTPTAYYIGADSFIVKATNGSVTTYTTIMVVVNRSPTVVMNVDYPTICNGGSTRIKVMGDGTPGGGDTIVKQDFNTSLGTWTVDTTGCVGSTKDPAWADEPNNYLSDFGYFRNPDSSSFAISQAIGAHPFSVTKSRLISPSFSLAGYSDAALYFDQSYKNNKDTCAEVDISTDGGVTWSTIVNYSLSYPTDLIGHIPPFVQETLSLRPYAGMPNLKVRFYYNSPHGFYWAIDNISVVGYPTGIDAATWSPIVNLFTNTGLTSAYTTGAYRDTLYMHPTTVTTTTSFTYFATESIGGCSVTDSVTITVTPSVPIIGKSLVCAGAPDTLTDVNLYGLWGVRNSHASIDFRGVLTGLTTGVDTVTYTTTGACGGTAIFPVTISTAPPTAGAITGAATVCTGAAIILSDATAGGIWSSSATGLATASGTGTVTGVSIGSATISYTVTNGCGTAVATTPVTVNPLPIAGLVTGAGTVCAGATTLLTDAVAGGTWSSAATGIATVSGGTVTGVSAGSVIISYIATNVCGTAVATATVTVNPLPVAGTIAGPSAICATSSTALSDIVTGGVWTSSATAIASVSGSGGVTGISAGSAVISYKVTNTCGTAVAIFPVTVNPLPIAGVITGSGIVCASSVLTLSDAISGGVWTSSTTGIATISGSGIVTGIAAGIAVISYSITNSCGTAVAIFPVTVNPLPIAGVITGSGTVCAGSVLPLSDAISGGVWTSSAIGIATISGTGIITGIAAGVAVISYSVTNSCGAATASATAMVNPLPVAGTITGFSNVCVDSNIILSDTAVGGVWASYAGITSITGTGVVTGVSAGVDTIIYSVTNGCGTATTKFSLTVINCDNLSAVSDMPNPGMELKVFPNPAMNSLNVVINATAPEVITIYMVNVAGEQLNMITRQVNAGYNVYSLDISNMPPDLYSLVVTGGTGTIVKKWVKL